MTFTVATDTLKVDELPYIRQGNADSLKLWTWKRQYIFFALLACIHPAPASAYLHTYMPGLLPQPQRKPSNVVTSHGHGIYSNWGHCALNLEAASEIAPRVQLQVASCTSAQHPRQPRVELS